MLKVRASVKKGTKIVFIWVSDDEDNDGIPVKMVNGEAWINLAELLVPRQLSAESGYQEQYAVQYSEPTDPVYPAIKFDMEAMADRRLTARERRRRGAGEG